MLIIVSQVSQKQVGTYKINMNNGVNIDRVVRNVMSYATTRENKNKKREDEIV